MGAEVIYQKKYPRVDDLAGLRAAELDPLPEVKRKPFDEFYKEMMESVVYVLMPERQAGCREFIQAAIEVSEYYELDTEIVRHESHVTASYSFDCGGRMQQLKRVFAMADDYSFFTGVNGRDLTILLDYYTHAEFRHGRMVAP